MKKPGFKRTRSIAGHQHCGVCHPDLKNGRSRERQQARKEAKEIVKEINPHHGSSFDSFLEEENILQEVEAAALERLKEN